MTLNLALRSAGSHKGRQHAPSLLRWAGSKRALLPRLSEILRTGVDHYVEPFCGSAALFFALSPARASLYDLNEKLIGILRTIRDSPEAVYEAFEAIPGTELAYYGLRARYNTEAMTDVEAASA